MTHTICYISSAKDDLTAKELESIFKTTATQNTKKGIKGVLLYSQGNFLQVLEGSKGIIDELYEEHIVEDGRHKNIFKVFDFSTEEPIFSDYKVSFDIVKSKEELALVNAYLDQNQTKPFTEKLKRLLLPFTI